MQSADVATARETTERTRDTEPTRAARMQRLLFVVASGGELDFGGARLALDDLDEVVIGRGLPGDVVASSKRGRLVTVADARVSTRHARVIRHENGFVIEDLGSTNGTTRNGNACQRAVLTDHDVIGVGHTILVYRELVDEGRASDRRARPTSGFVTLDPAFGRRLARLERVAASTVSIVLSGETGTGKEVLARAIHAASQRPGAFVAVNCGAIPPALVESHLFGHVKGAFSGAVSDAVGHVRAAHGGTLLLDEIGDLPINAQASLLRILQEGEVVPVGGTRPVPVDLRVIAATHKDLDGLVAKGTFREDLYARLAGYRFVVPPLRERRVDLGLLIAGIAARGKIDGAKDLRIHRDVLRAMLTYPWSMNVRELEQCVRSAAVLAENGLITRADVPPAIGDAPGPGDDAIADDADEALRRDLLTHLAATRGNVSEVARAMGKARQQVQRWLRRFGIDADAYKSLSPTCRSYVCNRPDSSAAAALRPRRRSARPALGACTPRTAPRRSDGPSARSACRSKARRPPGSGRGRSPTRARWSSTS